MTLVPSFLYWQHLWGYFQLILRGHLWKSLLSASDAGIGIKPHSVHSPQPLPQCSCTPGCVSRHTNFRESQNHRIRGWMGSQGSSGPTFHKHSLDKVAQHTAQHQRSVQHWGNHYHLPGEIIPMDYSHCEKIPLCTAGRSNVFFLPVAFFTRLLAKKEPPSSL